MLKDIKTKEHRAGAELLKMLRHAPKELAKKGLLAAKEKEKEQLLQAAQNGMGGADQAASEESAEAQLLRKTGERGRKVASSGGYMLCRAPGRKAATRRAHRLGDQRGHTASGHGGPPARQLKEKSPDRPRTQQGAAHGPRAGKPTDNVDWPTNVISVDMSLESRRKALQEGPYGRCVYRCDNNVVDKQMVQMQFDNGTIATLSMLAFTPHLTRTVRIVGTKGIIEGDLQDNALTLHLFGELI